MLTHADLTDHETLRAMALEDRLVIKGIMAKPIARQYSLICLERARSYAAHLQVMKVPVFMRHWVQEMTKESGQARLMVHHNELPWLEAFMVVRYGEAVEHWPMTLTPEDIKRARDWQSGKDIPKAVTMAAITIKG